MLQNDKKENVAVNPIEPLQLMKAKHVKYSSRMLKILPECLSSMEATRMTLVYFTISSLDVLEELDHVMSDAEKALCIDWIYRLQVICPKDTTKNEQEKFCNGFRGSTFACVSPEIEKHANCCNRNNGDKKVCFAEMMDSGHLAMTYTALATLVILGDNLSRVDRVSITRGLKEMQQPDGSFRASFEASENDMRFVYCACAIAHIVDDWSGIDKDAIVMFILSSLSYEGCFGQGPNLEAHGGSTYCAIASLSLMGRLHDGTLGQSQKDKAIRWCVLRLTEGFQGRPNKPDDTCYSFWIGAALRLLVPQGDKIEPVISNLASKSHQFVLSTQDAIVGGMAKWPELTSPDPLHTYLGLSGMSLFIGPDDNKSELLPIDAALNISKRAVTHLNHIKKICHTTDTVES